MAKIDTTNHPIIIKISQQIIVLSNEGGETAPAWVSLEVPIVLEAEIEELKDLEIQSEGRRVSKLLRDVADSYSIEITKNYLEKVEVQI